MVSFRVEGVVQVLAGIEELDLAGPGLGVWTVRDLVGHTCRAWSTVCSYLDPDVQAAHPRVRTAEEYFRMVLGSVGDPAEVAERGRRAGRELGDDPCRRATALADECRRRVDAAPDDAAVETPVGTMRLIDYLPTRAFELTVHGIDLCDATGRAIPDDLSAGIPDALVLCSRIASVDQQQVLIRALTGRTPLPGGFTVLEPRESA